MELVIIDNVQAWQLQDGDIITIDGVTGIINEPEDAGEMIVLTFKDDPDEEYRLDAETKVFLLGY